MTTKCEHLRIFGIASLFAFFCSISFADAVPEAFIACAAEDDDQRRLACYDREMTRQLPVIDAQTDVITASNADATANATKPVAKAVESVPPRQESSMTVGIAAAESVSQPATTGSATQPQVSSDSQGASVMKAATVPETAAEQATAPEQASQAVPDPQPTSNSPQQEDAGELSAIVTKVAQQPRGEHVIYLDNGQVWAEQTAGSYFPVKTGDTVSVKKRRFGGFRLLTESGKGFNVERLR